MSAPMITAPEREELARVLAQFTDKIVRVGVFGSRATGKAKANSDIDLVIYGDLDSYDERRLWTLFDDTSLPVSVDVVAYSLLGHPRLKAHIDSTSLTVFERSDLASRRKRRPTS